MKIKSPAKLNIFLKITGKRDSYHTLLSRFIRYDDLFDTIEIIKKQTSKPFELFGNFSCRLESNTLYKAYQLLQKNHKTKIDDFFTQFAVNVDKKIPEGSGLGGGSSNAASFMLFLNSELGLELSKNELIELGNKIGADVAFFLMEYKSANVSGVGEIVNFFNDTIPDIKLFFPPLSCNTSIVYSRYSKDYLKNININLARKMSYMSSEELLGSFRCEELNDLFLPALDEYKQLRNYMKDDRFFSGSGSTFFEVKNG